MLCSSRHRDASRTSIETRRAGRLLATLATVAASLALVIATGPVAANGVSSQSTTAFGLSHYAGTGVPGAPTPGPALNSALGAMTQMAVDSSGDLYMADFTHNVIEEVTPAGVLSIVAGTGTAGAPTPGKATSSELSGPEGVAVDSTGDLFIADAHNNVVEKVTPSGTLSIIAGNGTSSLPSAGSATSTGLADPTAVAVDSSGNVFIADLQFQEVFKVTPAGQLSVFAGNINDSGAPQAGPATSTAVDPEGICLDSSGDLYIADANQNQVLEVTPGGTLSIVAGTGAQGTPTAGKATSSKLSHPDVVAVDSNNNVYIDDAYNEYIEKVTSSGTLSIIAGDGAQGTTTPGLALDSRLSDPTAMAVNSAGDLFVDNYPTVDEIAPVSVAGSHNQ